MKIVHLATVDSSHRYLLLPQLVSLVEAGHEVVAVSAPGPDVAELARFGVRHVALDGSTRGFSLSGDLRAARSFFRILRLEKPDLVHTHNPKPGIYGRLVARAAGVERIVNTVHGLYATPEDRLLRRSVVYGLEAVASRASHLELVQSIEDADLMRRTPLAPTAKVLHLGNGIDLKRFDPALRAGRRASARAELGIGPDALVVGSVGRLVAEKGFHELLAASASLGPTHELVIVGPGDGEKADALQPAVLEAARARGVRFPGHRHDIERLLPAFDVFVLASYREGVPRAAMEAAASGLPVVATDIRGCRQVVEPGRTGLLVPRRSIRPLAEAMRSLIEDGPRRAAWGRAARVKAEIEFDERDVVARLLAAYERLGVVGPASGTVEPVALSSTPNGTVAR